MKKERNSKLATKYTKRLENRSVKRTLRHTFSTMIFTAIVLILLCSTSLQIIQHLNNRLAKGPLVMTKMISQINTEMSAVTTSTYDGILGVITPEEMKTIGMENVQKVTEDLAELEAYIIEFDDPKLSELLPYVNTLQEGVEQYSVFARSLCEYVEAGYNTAAAETFRNYSVDADNVLSDTMNGMNQIIEEKEASYAERTHGCIVLLAGIMLVLSIACGITSLFIVRNLCSFMDGSIEKMMTVLKRVSQGDLHATADLEGDNEFVELAKDLTKTIENINLYIEKEKVALSQMAEKDMTATIDVDFVGDFAPMKEAVNEITDKYNNFLLSTREAATDVSGAADNMSNVSQNLATSSTQQAASVQQLLAIIEDLNQNVGKVAKAAKEMSEASIKDNEEVLQGNEKMKELVDAMNQIEKSSKMIYGIVDMIEEIARKTSMLSLNATIEAARAGEQGRGFAVVAEEIRSLADASTEAVHKISDLIGSSLEAVEQGSNIAQDTASLFSNIVKNGEAHVEKTQEISKDCDNQSDTLHSVMCGVQEIAATVESNSQLAEEASAASDQLFASAQNMAAELQLFRLREDAGMEA